MDNFMPFRVTRKGGSAPPFVRSAPVEISASYAVSSSPVQPFGEAVFSFSKSIGTNRSPTGTVLS